MTKNNENDVLISVIIPVYNVELYLERCLNSIINQTYRNIEVICINDGSTDNSLEILKKYEKIDNRIFVINQSNLGLSIARNVGISHANGSYISFIDSDDCIDLQYYETVVYYINKYDIEFISCGMKIIYPYKVKKNQNPKFLVTKSFSRKIKEFNNGSICDKVIKKSLFIDNSISFIPGRFYEDNIVLLQLAYFSKKMLFINKVSYYYYYNSTSICNEDNEQKQLKRDTDKIFMIKQIIDYFNYLSLVEKYFLNYFVIRTIGCDYIYKKSKKYQDMKNIMGTKYLAYFKILSFLNLKLIRSNPYLINIKQKLVKRFTHIK